MRAEVSEGASGTFPERCREEAARLARLRALAADVLARCGGPGRAAELSEPTVASDRELEPEDRAILARWARARLLVIAEYTRWNPAGAQRHIYRFVGGELEEYRSFVHPRLELADMPTSKRAALRTLAHVLRSCAVVLAPIAPFTAESIHRTLVVETLSLFERSDLSSDSAADERLAVAWDRWARRCRGDRPVPKGPPPRTHDRPPFRGPGHRERRRRRAPARRQRRDREARPSGSP